MIYLFLAEGFEEVEALAVVDVLRRAGLEIKTVGLTHTHVTGAHQITVTTDLHLDEIVSIEGCELLILPGGQPGTNNLMKSKKLQDLLMRAYYEGKYIAAICAAPTVLENLGIIKGKRVTCYPSYQSQMISATVIDESVVVDDKIITGRGVGVALEFGLAIVAELLGSEKRDELFETMVMK